MRGLAEDDEVPPPVSPVIVRPSRYSSAALLVVTIIAGLMGLLLLYRATEPRVMTASSMSLPNSSPISMAPVVIPFPSVFVIVTNTPQATPKPTATYTMQPTPKPPDVCLTSTPRGTVCTQPRPPLPNPTPMADCPVSPGNPCVSRGGPVVWLTAVSIPE